MNYKIYFMVLGLGGFDCYILPNIQDVLSEDMRRGRVVLAAAQAYNDRFCERESPQSLEAIRIFHQTPYPRLVKTLIVGGVFKKAAQGGRYYMLGACIAIAAHVIAQQNRHIRNSK